MTTPIRSDDAPATRPRCHPGAFRPLIGLLLLPALVRAGPLRAQQKAQAGPPSADSTTVHHGVSPRGAFLRALALPGWGHAAIGSYNRGAFYFVMESATAWQLIRTRERLMDARRRHAFREMVLRQDLAAEGITDPSEIQTRLNADEKLTDLDALATARKSQQEDWIALGVFVVFLSGADAYVSAHLSHFPAPLSLRAAPSGMPGRMDLGFGVRLPRR